MGRSLIWFHVDAFSNISRTHQLDCPESNTPGFHVCMWECESARHLGDICVLGKWYVGHKMRLTFGAQKAIQSEAKLSSTLSTHSQEPLSDEKMYVDKLADALEEHK